MNKKWLYLAIGCVAMAAQAGKAIAGVPVPDLDERTLQEKYHIAPTEDGLIGALQHQDQSVRNFAATKLANNGDKAAVRPILAALAVEKLEGSKIVLATAAAEFGAAEGFSAIKSMCEDRNWSPVLRMSAAQSMVIILGRQECLPDILEVLLTPTNYHQADAMALNLLSSPKAIPPSQLDQVRDLSTTYLKSQAPDLRMFASHLIRILGGPWAVSQLQAALDVERDEDVRRTITSELYWLRQ